MKTYRSREEVVAMLVGDIQGYTATEAKPGKERLQPGDKGSVDLGYTWVGQHVVRIGDYVTYKDGQPQECMDEKTFKAAYKEKK